MAGPLDIAALNAAALADRRATLRRLWHPDGRVSAEVRALNLDAPVRFGLHISANDAGVWFVSHPDMGMTRGSGFVALVAHLAAVSEDRAGAFLARIVATPEAAA